ncbi:uncharacterized protein [Halyomorpha halys]|uniref:uncharacterized protein n=1 Tax=Halyomorpha halys TaxID=286706 RepID=UPI0006D518CA|nr:uncharacterized protein LOC106684784 [Halyomorpha halys]XP_014282543.1 uncharacterized protein LOC106684784 [Halyomorpha halys]XP_024218585.1 uncharacterized protein LOC106684784 [Halyomorpha halys]
MSTEDCGCLNWAGRLWRRVVRAFGGNRPPTPPPLPPPVYYYTPPPLVRPRSAFGGMEPGSRPNSAKPEAKRMRFQPPTPETLLQIKQALDELPVAVHFAGKELHKGMSISEPDFGAPTPGTSGDDKME